MTKAVFYFWALAILDALYIVMIFVFFLSIKSALKQTNIAGAKSLLGANCQYRQQTNGWTKYKWQKGLMTVRASFDEQEQLIEYEIKPYKFPPFTYKKSFG